MITQVHTDTDRSINREFSTMAQQARVERTPGRITVVFVDEVLGF